MSLTEKDFTELTPSLLMKSLRKDGTLFFDSAGNFPHNYQSPLSLIAHDPVEIFRGHILDTAALECVMREYTETDADLGYPTSGLAGWVDFEGNYTFGRYEKFWVYSHEEEKWLQEGMRTEPSEEDEELDIGPWQPTVSPEEFIQMVQAVQEYIAQGEVYQVNLSHQYHAEIKSKGSAYSLYEKLRDSSPSPMACYGNLGRRELLCSSPETFLRMSGRVIETRPIKGTSPRFPDSERDHLSSYKLMTSEKEKAELLMITDLLRNDLGQISEYGSVEVADLLQVEKLEHVYHMVSTIRGQLRADLSQLDVLSACLPGGSITGAPKIRALEVIEELEKTQRGIYTGVVGYLGFNGESQFNIAIRSLVREGEKLHYHVGAGIVADSDPELEYAETLIKAEGIRRALSFI